MPQKRALIWAAVSTRPQADEDKKFSIPKQIEDGEAMCKREGWQIVDVLKVPGHSRDYRTLDQLAADARKRDIDAFDKLIQHLDRADFDIFICRDANRFARKASLLHYIAEMIVEDCGAVIYSQNDDMFVDEDKLPMWATLQGYKVRAEVKTLVKQTRDGLLKRVERGLTTTRFPWSHNLIYDDKHRAIGVEADESKRRLFDDLAYLITEEHHPFNGIEHELYERFGHVADDGLPYGDNKMYLFLYHPLTWGIASYGMERRDGERRYGAWVFDEDCPPPEGVEFVRDAIVPVYSGDQAERLKGELRRRGVMHGNWRPAQSNALSGLFVCDECHYTLAVKTNWRPKLQKREPVSLRCNMPNKMPNYQEQCTQKAFVPYQYFVDYLDALLRRLLETRDLSEILPSAELNGQSVKQVEDELNTLYEDMDALIALQKKAHEAAQNRYQLQIDALAEQSQILARRIVELKAAARHYETELTTALAALDDIEPLMDKFWQLDPPVINQLLHRLMGTRRFVVRDRLIRGVVPQRTQRTRRRPNKPKPTQE